MGNMFGFVRFIQVSNSNKLLAALKTIWVGSFKLVVESAWDRGRQRGQSTLVHVLKNREQVTNNIDKRLWSSRIPDRGQRKTFAKVVRQEHITSGELKQLTPFHEGMEFKVEQTAMEGIFCDSAPTTEVAVGRIYTVQGAAYGGALVLLSSSNSELLKSYVRVDARRLGRWFANIRPWSHKEGTPVRVDGSTRRKESFEMAHVLVLITTTELINEVVRVKINDHIFLIMVVEERGGTSVWLVSVAKCEDHTLEGVSSDKTIGEWCKVISRVPATQDSEVFGNFEVQRDSNHNTTEGRSHGSVESNLGGSFKGVVRGTVRLEEDFGLPNEGMGLLNGEGPVSNCGLQEDDGSIAHCTNSLNMVLRVLKKKKKGGSGAKEPKPAKIRLKLLLRKPKGKGRTKRRGKVKSSGFEYGEVIRSCEAGEEGTPVLTDAAMSRSTTSLSNSDSLRPDQI
ncbi:hypothetical protein Ancab_000926 [Ancistrocladus abbreviatus]